MVEPQRAGFEPLRPPHCPADCQLSEDDQNPQGEGLRPGTRGGPGRVSFPNDKHHNHCWSVFHGALLTVCLWACVRAG